MLKIDVMLSESVIHAARRARELERTGVDGVFSFENAHDVFFPLVAAAPVCSLGLLISDNYSGRPTTIRLAGSVRPGGGSGSRGIERSHGDRRAGQGDEAETDGRKVTGGGGGSGRDERPVGTAMACRRVAVGEQTGEDVAHA
jgi:hypothetical protein